MSHFFVSLPWPESQFQATAIHLREPVSYHGVRIVSTMIPTSENPSLNVDGFVLLPRPENRSQAQAHHIREPVFYHGVGITYYDTLPPQRACLLKWIGIVLSKA